jgi:hypothetical protein
MRAPTAAIAFKRTKAPREVDSSVLPSARGTISLKFARADLQGLIAYKLFKSYPAVHKLDLDTTDGRSGGTAFSYCFDESHHARRVSLVEAHSNCKYYASHEALQTSTPTSPSRRTRKTS